jgi:hypothetical protein
MLRCLGLGFEVGSYEHGNETSRLTQEGTLFKWLLRNNSEPDRRRGIRIVPLGVWKLAKTILESSLSNLDSSPLPIFCFPLTYLYRVASFHRYSSASLSFRWRSFDHWAYICVCKHFYSARSTYHTHRQITNICVCTIINRLLLYVCK